MSAPGIDYATLTYLAADHVATVSINRPHRRNALSWQTGQDLIAALERAASDPDVRVVVLTGASDSFCVGADLAADPETRTLRTRSTSEDTARLNTLSRITTLLYEMPKPTIAAINGACAGAGLSLALATDIRIAVDRAVLNTAFVAAGLSGDLGSAWLLTRAVGPARARQLLLLPEKVDASRAQQIGLVHDVVADLPTAVAELTARLTAGAPLALTAAKQNLNDAVDLPLEAYLHAEVARMVRCAHSGDAVEAAQAFLAKRPPLFTGR
jgi:2-(1,2-epoxy-1,2-dihydrophenyl)acetyl-CoA isomerase